MTITEQQRLSMLEAAKPLMKWMADNRHPHCSIMMDAVAVELVEAVARVHTLEFVEKGDAEEMAF